MSGALQGIDRLGAGFDDESLVADAGLLAAGTLMDRLGLEGLMDTSLPPAFATFTGALCV